MGLISAALLGGTEGFGTGLAKAGELQWKDEHERMREEAQATREARNIALTGSQARETEAAKPVHVAPGATVQRPGQPDFQAPAAPEKQLTQEQVDLLKAQAEYYRAHGRAVDRTKEEKPTFPKLLKSENGDGSVSWIDQNTNAMGTVIPGVAPVAAEHNWIFPNKPAVAGKPASMVWNVGGEVMTDREYNQRFYGNANKVSGVSGASPAATPAQSRPSLASFMPGAQAAPQAPAQPAAQPQAQPVAQAPALPQGSGNAVDAARTKLSAAQQTLQSYGLMQQRRDPQGFAVAKQAVAAAKQDLDTSMSQYQNELGPVGAARPLLRMK